MSSHLKLVVEDKIVLFTLPLLIFLVWLFAANELLFHFFNQASVYTGTLVWLMLTHLGDSLIVLSLSPLLLYFRPRLMGDLFIAAILVALLVQGIKFALDLPRPPAVFSPDEFILLQDKIIGLSFPSGHTATAFVVVSVLLHGLKTSLISRLFLFLLALLIAISRMVVGVHWPYDVLAGAFIGWFLGLAAIWLNSLWNFGSKPVQQKILLATGFLAFNLLLAARDYYTSVIVLYYGVLLLSLLFIVLSAKKIFQK